MEPTIVEKGQIVLVGLSFFGDPFRLHGGWEEENEIGRLWLRFMTYLQQRHDQLPAVNAAPAYEVHIDHAERQRTGEYEVFVGIAIDQLATAPFDALVKFLPPATYAVFTLAGTQIGGDWPQQIEDWMSRARYQRAYAYEFQYYDERFKGIDHIAESEIDVYVPITRLAE